MANATDILINGCKVIEEVVRPNAFQFQFRGSGNSSGGLFAWGEFVRDDRRLELHFRSSLGLVRYHVGDQSAAHELYMRELDVWDKCQYPGFSETPTDAFHHLAHDLKFAQDFLSGSADVLREAAKKDLREATVSAEQSMTFWDRRKLEQLKNRFREKQYGEVIRLAAELEYPDQISQSEQRMVDIALSRGRNKYALMPWLQRIFQQRRKGRD